MLKAKAEGGERRASAADDAGEQCQKRLEVLRLREKASIGGSAMQDHGDTPNSLTDGSEEETVRLEPSTVGLEHDLHADCHCFHSGHDHLSHSESTQVQSPTSMPAEIYVRCVRPKRIILVRHGESMGNIDGQVYVTTPDWRVPLSALGLEQARIVGKQIKEVVGDEPLYFYTSPYLRTKQTLEGMLPLFEKNLKVGIREEPRITEQQFGNFQNYENMCQAKRERHFFGRFYYRFPQGESGLDVYTRVTSFISTMFRDFADIHIGRPDLNVIIVTHGLTLRLLLMRWFKLGVETFESTTNPSNCAFLLMTRKGRLEGKPGGGYELSPESARLISLAAPGVPTGEGETTGNEDVHVAACAEATASAKEKDSSARVSSK